MNHDQRLANDLVVRSLMAKIERLEARIAALETARRPYRCRAQRAKPDQDADAFAALTGICQPIAAAHGIDLFDLRGREIAPPRLKARAQAMTACLDAGFTLKLVGRFFDGRDHTTILHLIGRRTRRKGIGREAKP